MKDLYKSIAPLSVQVSSYQKGKTVNSEDYFVFVCKQIYARIRISINKCRFPMRVVLTHAYKSFYVEHRK